MLGARDDADGNLRDDDDNDDLVQNPSQKYRMCRRMMNWRLIYVQVFVAVGLVVWVEKGVVWKGEPGAI